MRNRTRALLTLLAALTIAGFLLHDRERDPEPAQVGSPVAPAEIGPTIELVAAQPVREPLRRAEDDPAESRASNNPSLPPRVEAKPAQESPVLEAPDSVLVFRALDQAGRVVRGELSVATTIRSQRHSRSSGTNTSTDAKGNFEVRIESSLAEDKLRELEVSARARTLMARVDLTRSFPPGRIDMGDLVLTPTPLIAEGRVIDAAGRPVAGVTIQVHTVTVSPEETARSIEPIYFGETQTGEDGVFALYGSTSAASMEIRLRQDEPISGRPLETLPPGIGYVGLEREADAPRRSEEQLRAAPLELPVGSRGIQIVAQRSGGVAGRVLLDPGVSIGAFRMILRPENVPPGGKLDPSDSSWSLSRTETADDGRFQIVGLLPWRYTFSIAAGRSVLLEIPGIEIVPDEISSDPRLETLDLRSRLHVFTLDLVRAAPSSALTGFLCFTESGTRTPVCRQSFAQSPVVIVTPFAGIDAMVRARDCRIARLSDLAERTEVQLRPCLTVRLVLPREILLPAPPLFVGAWLEREDELREERARSYSEVRPPEPFDEHGHTICQAYEPGRHAVRWFVWFSNGANPLAMPFDQVVVVEDREDEQRIELAVTNEDLTRALADR